MSRLSIINLDMLAQKLVYVELVMYVRPGLIKSLSKLKSAVPLSTNDTGSGSAGVPFSCSEKSRESSRRDLGFLP